MRIKFAIVKPLVLGMALTLGFLPGLGLGPGQELGQAIAQTDDTSDSLMPIQPSQPGQPGTSFDQAPEPLPRRDDRRVGGFPKINWRVENSFRFFNNPGDTALHRATYEALSDDDRVAAPVLTAERALARRHPDGWAVSVAKHTCWNRASNRHACPKAGDYINPKGHRIVAQLTNVADITTVDCTWQSTPLDGRSLRTKKLTVPCDTAVKFEAPYPSGLVLSVIIGGQPVAETIVVVKDLLIVGMGDSFASGEGNPDIPVRFSRERTTNYGTPKDGASLAGYPARVGPWKQIGDARFIKENARWLDQACHRSLYSYQLRVALQLAVENPHRAVTFVGLSCSGAETTFGLFLRYKGNEWVPHPPQYSQISAAAVAQCGSTRALRVNLPEAYHLGNKLPELSGLILKKCKRGVARRIDLLLLSIGGNDIGFARLVANAVLSDSSMLRKLGGWFGQVHGAKKARKGLRLLQYRYKALNRALHNVLHIPWTQSDRIILTGYPRMAVMLDGKTMCPDGPAGMTVVPEFNLSSRKAAESGLVARRLFGIMQRVAKQYKWSFASAHRDAFLGRGICAGASRNGSSGGVFSELELPRKRNGRWEPYNPADWQAYASRKRWFRTPNDAFMTGNFHVQTSVVQKVLKLDSLSWFQLLLASTYSGAFHPTAEGQAAIADAVVVKARDVLQRYDKKG